uniref:Centrosomal protein 85 n=1 Tax=Leptobrachium leishanense TaxID=445787 RepID=A0A8C5M4J9_9ANUR
MATERSKDFVYPTSIPAGFCNTSGSSSFQPVKNQLSIPTAHVVPSTLVMRSNTSEHLGPSTVVDSNLHSFPFQPSLDQLASDDSRKFETPNIEPTLNQSTLLQTFCTNQRPSASTEGVHVEHEPFRILPESRESAHGGHVRIAGDKPLSSQLWRTQPYSHHATEFGALRQLHELDNIRLGMEQLQLARGHPPQLYLDHKGLGRVFKANENVLLEEILVERQRQHISQLEQKLRESEVQIHNTVLSPVNPYNDVFMIRLQELQREVTFLRAQFAEKNDSCNQEKAELEKKLAACEIEAGGLKESAMKTSQNYTEEIRKQEERVKARDRHINALKKKCQKEAEHNKEKQERIETLERYLADLPTVNDHQNQTQELNGLKEKNFLLQNQVHELEIKLGEVRSLYREKELELKTEKTRGKELLSNLHRVQEELEHSKAPGLSEEEKRVTKETESMQQEVQTLQSERDCLKKVVENQKKKMEQLCSQVKELEEQISQEEGTGQVMKDETQKKENALLQLKEAVRELAGQNQDLMERNIYLEEQLQQTKTGVQLSCVENQTMPTLYKEMKLCLKELRSVYSLLCQAVQGVDPNLSMLLGIHTSITEDNGVLERSSLENFLSDVSQLKRDIDDLRTTISDRYAQDMGDNCITQ